MALSLKTQLYKQIKTYGLCLNFLKYNFWQIYTCINFVITFILASLLSHIPFHSCCIRSSQSSSCHVLCCGQWLYRFSELLYVHIYNCHTTFRKQLFIKLLPIFWVFWSFFPFFCGVLCALGVDVDKGICFGDEQ